MKMTTLLLVLGAARIFVDYKVKQEVEDLTGDGFFGVFTGAVDSIASDFAASAAEEARDVLDLALVTVAILSVI